MKAILTPLFLCQRHCRNCVRVLRRQNPEKWLWEFELEKMPPLGSFHPKHGFRPDYSTLLMFEEFIIDGEASECILSKTAPPWMGQWPAVLSALKDEGTLHPLDLDDELKRVRHVRGGMLRKDMRNPKTWASGLDFCENMLGAAGEAFEGKRSKGTHFDWTYDPDHSYGVPGSDGEIHSLASCPLLEPGTNPNDPHYQLHGMAIEHIRRQLREVNAALALSASLGAPPVLWAPYARYLELKESAVGDQRLSRGAKQFFETAFPLYAPNSARDLIRLRKDRRVGKLRDEIKRAVDSGDLLDPAYPQRILAEVLRVEQKVRGKRRIIAWLSSAVGCVPLPGVSIAATGLGEITARYLERRHRKPWAWFYLISNGCGHS